MATLEGKEELVAEYEEVFKKTTALGLFLQSKAFQERPAPEQFLIENQWETMQHLGLILSKRIAGLNPI